MANIPEPIKVVLRPVRKFARAVSRRSTLSKLESCGVPHAAQIAKAIRASVAGTVADPAFTVIEAERSRLRDCRDPLVDGTLSPVWVIDEGKTVADACGVSIKSDYPKFLYSLARNLGAKQGIELGTNVGISSAYIGIGLQRANDQFKFVTLDASVYRQRLAKGIHQKIGLSNITYLPGLFEETLSDAISRLGKIDFAFIDGDHTYKSTLSFFEQFHEVAVDNAVFVFDDIRWSDGMLKAWQMLEKDPRIAVSIDFDRIGICIVGKATGKPPLNFKLFS